MSICFFFIVSTVVRVDCCNFYTFFVKCQKEDQTEALVLFLQRRVEEENPILQRPKLKEFNYCRREAEERITEYSVAKSREYF